MEENKKEAIRQKWKERSQRENKDYGLAYLDEVGFEFPNPTDEQLEQREQEIRQELEAEENF